LITENTRFLVTFRLEQADESLEAAQILLDKGLLRPSVNRSYYAMFYAVLALLALKKRETSKHSGAIAIFDKEFVKEGAFPKEFSHWIHSAFDLRQRSDYATWHQITQEVAKDTLLDAYAFVKGVKENLRSLMDQTQ
jgi:uncharacterized protein (UPF0332 family)